LASDLGRLAWALQQTQGRTSEPKQEFRTMLAMMFITLLTLTISVAAAQVALNAALVLVHQASKARLERITIRPAGPANVVHLPIPAPAEAPRRVA
jgi:hypothetical protein